MSIKSERFAEMRAIRDEVLEEVALLEQQLSRYTIYSDGALTDYVLSYFRKKLERPPVRPYLLSKLFDYLLQYSSEQVVRDTTLAELRKKLCLILEATITVQYLHNHILDEKFDFHARNYPRLWQNLLASDILKELLFEYLDLEIKPLLSEVEDYIKLQDALRRLFLNVNIGQRLDKHFSNYGAFMGGVSQPLDPRYWLEDDFCRNLIGPFVEEIAGQLDFGRDFLKLYFHRIYLTNVYFFRVIAQIVIGFLPEISPRRHREVEAFSILYGFMLQIINDYADFAYSEDEEEKEFLETGAKKSTDVFADLYNFNITLPLILHLQHGHKRKVEAYLHGGQRKRNLIANYPRQIMAELLDTGSIQYCIALTRRLADAADRHLDPSNPTSAILQNMTDMARSNKYYEIFK